MTEQTRALPAGAPPGHAPTVSDTALDQAVRFRQARLDDTNRLMAIELAAFDGDRLSRRAMKYHIRSRQAALLVAEVGGDLLGYVLVSCRGDRPARVFSLAVTTAAAGRGIGRELMRAGEEAAAERGFGRIALEVREDNAPARALYGALDYQETGREEGYYEDGATALKLEKSLVEAMADSPSL